MHKKKENLFPTFLQLYLRQVLLFTSYGLGTLNPTVIIGLAMVLLLAFKQYGIELFSIKTKLQLLPDCFSAAFALTLSIGRQIQFQYVSANYTKTTIADGSIFTFLFISPFCVFFLFYNRFIYQCQNWKHFYCSKHTGFLFKKIFFILYCLFSSVLASLSVGIVSWSGFA